MKENYNHSAAKEAKMDCQQDAKATKNHIQQDNKHRESHQEFKKVL